MIPTLFWGQPFTVGPLTWLPCVNRVEACFEIAAFAVWGPCTNWRHDPMIVCEWHAIWHQRLISHLEGNTICPVCAVIGGDAFRYVRLERVPFIQAWWKERLGITE